MSNKEKLKVPIDRRFWLRGPYAKKLHSKLCTFEGMKCCLGFLAVALGADEDALIATEAPDPWEAFDNGDFNNCPDWLIVTTGPGLSNNSTVACDLMKTNDDNLTTDAYKESEINRLAKEHGVEFVFSGPRLPKRMETGELTEVTYEEAEDGLG